VSQKPAAVKTTSQGSAKMTRPVAGECVKCGINIPNHDVLCSVCSVDEQSITTTHRFRPHPQFVGTALAGTYGDVIKQEVEEAIEETKTDGTFIRFMLLEPYAADSNNLPAREAEQNSDSHLTLIEPY